MDILFLHSGYSPPVVPEMSISPQSSFIDDLKARRDNVSYDVSRDGTATIDINGPIMSSVPLIYIYFDIPAVGTFNLLKTIQSAVANSDVKRIHFNVNSPGGTSLGLEECALAISNSPKPTSGSTVEGAFSAGYWLLSQCDTIEVSRSASVGSLGSYIVVDDYSKMFEQQGIKTHVISSGGVKGLGVPGSEVTDTQLAFLDKKVKEVTGDFKAAVKRGRGNKIDNLDSLFTGEWWNAKQAVKMGLADRVTLGGNMTDKKDVGSEEQTPRTQNKDKETPVATVDLSGVTAQINTLTETVSTLAGVVSAMASERKQEQADNAVEEAIKSGLVSADDSEKAGELLAEVGAEKFRAVLALRAGIEPNPVAHNVALRENKKGALDAVDKATLTKWGVDPEVVAKYGNVAEIDAYNRKVVHADGKVEKFAVKAVSNLTDGFQINGIPNGELKKIEVQNLMRSNLGEVE